MSTETRAKPPYLGFLNYYSQAESRGGETFRAWAARTSDADLRTTLELVAGRESEHGASVARRIGELGYDLRPRDFSGDDLGTFLASEASDLEKLRRLCGTVTGDGVEELKARAYADEVDADTRALFDRIIPEEADSVARLQAALQARETAGS